jgi:hypothetical protein
MDWKCSSDDRSKSFTYKFGRDHLAREYLKTRKEMEE